MELPLGQRLRELPGPLLLTGHTGFKGAWMTFLLEHLKVPVVGYALPAEKDSLYSRAKRDGKIPEKFADIRDYQALEAFMDEHKPSTIIHMAAQPLVLKSYQFPRETFEVNVMGTANILDVASKKDSVRAVIVVTTDKVYRNDNSGRSFKESDPLEGKDPYSASKVGAEAVVAAWQQITKLTDGAKVVSVRAGNIIGGGDFAEDRLVPDLIRGLINGTRVNIRNPKSTRPWQHVLDPCRGYILALEYALTNGNLRAVNFGPENASLSVGDILKVVERKFPEFENFVSKEKSEESKEFELEQEQLNLDSGLGRSILGYEPIWRQEEAIEMTLIWWEKIIYQKLAASDVCEEEIRFYLSQLGLDAHRDLKEISE
jgi:CDP-glucose 4,6-dehydratase